MTNETDLRAAIPTFLEQLELTRRLAVYYPADHPAFAEGRRRLETVLDLPPGEELVQIRPSGFFIGEDPLHRPGSPARRFAAQLFAAGLVGVVIRSPLAEGDMGSLLDAITALPSRPGPDDREAFLEATEGMSSFRFLPLDASRFLSAGSGLISMAGRSLWEALVSGLTGGALGTSGEGGLTPGEMARLVEEAGDPTGFLELLVEHLLRLLGRAEERGAMVEGLGLIGSAEEMVRALSPDRQRLAGRLMVQHAAPPDSLAARLPEVLEPRLVLDGVEALIAGGIAVPSAVQRLVYQLAAPISEASDPWRRRGIPVDPDTIERARTLLQRIPDSPAATPETAASEPEEPWSARPEIARALEDGKPFSEALARSLGTGAVRGELTWILETVMAPEAGFGPTVRTAAQARLADVYVEHVELGEFDAALGIADRLSRAGDETALGRLSGPEGLSALLEALATWGKEQRRAVLAIVHRLGERFVPAILERLAEEKGLSNRKRLLEMVVAVGAPAIPYLREELTDERWFVVRNAVMLLRRLKDPRLAEEVRPLLEHGNPKVVAEAVLGTVAAGGREWIRGLDRLLRSGDPAWIHEGLVLASKLRHREVGRRIVEFVRGRTGVSLRDPVVLEAIETLGYFEGEEVEAELRRLAGLSTWRTTFRLTPVWTAVARAAARIPGEGGTRILERLASQKDPSSELARKLLAQRRGGSR